jgi:hypothetical protein
MRTDQNIPDPDGFYEALLAATTGLSEAESEALILRLVLLLANQVGDQQILLDAIDAAKAPARGAG